MEDEGVKSTVEKRVRKLEKDVRKEQQAGLAEMRREVLAQQSVTLSAFEERVSTHFDMERHEWQTVTSGIQRDLMAQVKALLASRSGCDSGATAQLEAAIADCRRELEAQREQLPLHAETAREAARKAAKDAARDVAREASREVARDVAREEVREAVFQSARDASKEAAFSPRTPRGPAAAEVQELRGKLQDVEKRLLEMDVAKEAAFSSRTPREPAVAEVQELRGKMQDVEKRLLEMISLARRGESAYISRDELRTEAGRVRAEMQALRQDHLDRISTLQEQLTQPSGAASDKAPSTASSVPEVTTKDLSDKSSALADQQKDIMQLSDALKDLAKAVGAELANGSAKAAEIQVQLDEEVSSLRQALEETSCSMSRFVQDREEKVGRAEKLAANDSAGVADPNEHGVGQFEAAIADLRRELTAQQEQFLLQADITRKAAQEVARDVLREELRDVERLPASPPTPVVASAQVQELSGKMHDFERGLAEIVALTKQSESTYVSRDELHSETGRVRNEVQALQHDHQDKIAVLQGQLAQAYVSASDKEQATSVPEVTPQDLSDIKDALAESRNDMTQHSEAPEDMTTTPCVSELVISSTKTAAALAERDEEVLSLRRWLEEVSSSLSRFVEDFEGRFSSVAESVATDKAGLADLKNLFEEAFKALAKEVAQERKERFSSLDDVSRRFDEVALKTLTLIDEVAEASDTAGIRSTVEDATANISRLAEDMVQEKSKNRTALADLARRTQGDIVALQEMMADAIEGS